MRTQVESSGRTERRTFAGAALRGPKPSDGLAAVVTAEEEERGGSQTRNRGAGGARHEAEDEDMSGVAVWVWCGVWRRRPSSGSEKALRHWRRILLH